MNKFFLFLSILLISMSLVTGHAGESHQEEVDGKIITLEFLPFEPKTASATILAFEVNDADGKSVTHIDGFLDIKRDGELLVNDYELHSHGNQFSMTYKFQDSGQYTATLTVQASEHYENEKFDPVSVIFYITVGETATGGNSFVSIVGTIATLGILAVLVFVVRKKK